MKVAIRKWCHTEESEIVDVHTIEPNDGVVWFGVPSVPWDDVALELVVWENATWNFSKGVKGILEVHGGR